MVCETASPQERIASLERAVANVTRLLAAADDPAVAADLAAERRAMRAELEALRQAETIDLDTERRARGHQ
jgi:precorrin isomerase